MPLGILFWVLYVVSVIFGAYVYYEPPPAPWFRRFGGYLVLWILVGILGWHAFGPVVR